MANVKDNREESLAEQNKAILEAWCEWKRICSILMCDKQNSALLAKEVAKAFVRKLNGALGDNIRLIGESELERKKLAHEFDCGIIEKADFAKTRKNYKDYIWLKLSKSEDPPLKVIRGGLTGTQGIINEIVEKWLKDKGWQMGSRKDPNTGKRVDIWYKPESLDGKIYKDDNDGDDEDSSVGSDDSNPDEGAGGENGEEQPDFEDEPGEDGQDSPPDTPSPSGVAEDLDHWFDDLDYEGAYREVIDVVDAAIMAARVYKLSVTTDKKLLEFTGLSKSAISKRMQDFARKFSTRLNRDVFEELEAGNPAASSALFSTVVKILCESEGGREFLSYAKAKADAKDSHAVSRDGGSRPLPQFLEIDFYSQPTGGNSGNQPLS